MRICKKVKKIGLENVYQSAAVIVETVLREDMPTDSLCVINPRNLARAANYTRQKQRPEDPTDIDFELQLGNIVPGFVLQDIAKDTARHIIFATPEQRELLRSVKQVFMDGTFRVVRKPFTQLFSFHGFLMDEDDLVVKQVPLAFVLMSRRRKRDYVAVFKAIRDIAPHLDNVDIDLVTDFEPATWEAAAKVFPKATMHGCSFHWAQAVMRAVQLKGLIVAYKTDLHVNRFIKKLFALPYLPVDEIEGAFDRLASSGTEEFKEEVKPIVDYIRNTWMNGCQQYSKPTSWCVYNRAIRTNNDVEGWHNKLNKAAGGRASLPFYSLVALLYGEADWIRIELRLLTADQLRRYQRKETKTTQRKLFKLWQDYENQTISISQLVRKLSHLDSVIPRTADEAPEEQSEGQ